MANILAVFASAAGAPAPALDAAALADRLADQYPAPLRRTSAYLTHPVFNTHHSETQMMRYIRSLEAKDIGLETSMIPLGSCTMKLNAAAEMLPVTWPEFSRLHPFAPVDQAAGYSRIFRELEAALCEITGFAAVSLQPNSGAQGELAGLLVIRAYHRSRGDHERNIVLIPASAHGTNPASGVMAGMRVVVVATARDGSVDVDDLRAKAAQHAAHLGRADDHVSLHARRVRGPDSAKSATIVHAHGGQVYMDGANMNAQVGLTSPASIGADVCHLNLHKTFAIPHGGGGPGMGPIGVAAHLAPFLPGHPVVEDRRRPRRFSAVAAAPYGSPSILLISYGYISMLGRRRHDAPRPSTRCSTRTTSRRASRRTIPCSTRARTAASAHEMIFDMRAFKAAGVEEIDIAKRLMDYGFHAPTVSFPVPGTLMIEPTESEPKEELDRFCDAMIAIRGEIQAVVSGKADARDNVLKNAPHTAAMVSDDEWSHPVLAPAGGVSAAVRAREQVLAQRGADRQPVRRSQPVLRLPVGRHVRREGRRLNAACRRRPAR